MILLVIITLLCYLMRVFKVQWCSLWYHTSIYLYSVANISLVDHRISMLLLVSSYQTTSMSTLSTVMVNCYRVSLGDRKSSNTSRVSSWPIIIFSRCHPTNLWLSTPWWCFTMYTVSRYYIESYLMGKEGYNGLSRLGYGVGAMEGFLFEVWDQRLSLRKGVWF